MTTPIFDFVTKYSNSHPVRFHMPGHKGTDALMGIEHLDITEIDGADNLWSPDGIIAESEKNASEIFGAHTFYSTEGSSLCIRGMLFLVKKYALINNKRPLIIAGRNAHKTFVNTAAILDIDVEYVMPEGDEYLESCSISADAIREILDEKFSGRIGNAPTAVYITSPDYLGNIADIEGIAKVCHERGVLLIVDNAHGAYLKFLEKSLHPIDLGADMCADSAHKTLPVLTGGAYLHVSLNADDFFMQNAKSALELFATTSPSYLIMESLDLCNRELSETYIGGIREASHKTALLKKALTGGGYRLIGDEALKITIDAKARGYTGGKINEMLNLAGIYVEHYDDDFVVFMISKANSDDDFLKLKEVLLSRDLSQKDIIRKSHMPISDSKVAMRPIKAMLSESETVSSKESVGRIVAEAVVACPPCVPEYMAGEVITSVPQYCEKIKVVKNG